MNYNTFETLDDGFCGVLISNDGELIESQVEKDLDNILAIFNPETLPDAIKKALSEHDDLSNHNLDHSLLLFGNKNGDAFEIITSRIKPEKKHNWVKVVEVFIANTSITEPDEEGVYAFGQPVPSDGEYLCRDCGFIDDFKAGEYFNVCEVCLAGDPDGPLEITAGYWEKL
jgi:hypothetical protein